VIVDPGSPRAWTQEPFYSQLKRWAAAAVQADHQLVVFQGMNATVILPDRDVAVGTVAVGDEIFIHRRAGQFEVEVRRPQQ
jgi:hypothetical protein